MKSVYIIFFGTDLKTGRMIRAVTRNPYNHVSISTDGLESFYSFSRLYFSHPMVGGFVEESPNRYLMSDRTVVKIVRIDVSEATYKIICRRLRLMQMAANEYVYNYMSIVGYAMGRRIRRDRAYTCVEFVRDTLAYAGLLPDSNGDDCVRIPDLERELSCYDTEEGTATELFDYSDWGSDAYLDEVGRIKATKEACRRLKHMILDR